MSNGNTSPIDGRVKLVIEGESNSAGSPEQLRSLQEAIDVYNDLVDRGLTKRRGYSLMTADNKHYDRSLLNLNRYCVSTETQQFSLED